MPERGEEAKAPARSFWSGTIAFGLVSIPVDLFTAVRARRTSMKMVDGQGRPLGREYRCPRDDEKLSAAEIVRGFEAEDGEMIVVTDEELESVAPEMSRDIELRRFVPLEQIPPMHYQRPYFLAPSGRSAKAYHLLAMTMEQTGRVGVGTFVMRGHQYLVAVLSDGGVLRAETLRFADELRSPEDIGLTQPATAKAKDVKALAKAIDSLMRDALDIEELSDRYAEEIRTLAEAKEKKHEDVVHLAAAAEDEDEEAGGADVIDLASLLRARLKGKTKVKPVAAGPSAAPPAHRARPKAKVTHIDRLEKLSREALYDRAQKLDVPGRSKMGRKQLIAAIRKAG